MRIITLLLIMALSTNLLAQVNDYYDRMNFIFGGIDKTKVNTSLLKEFGIRFNEVEAYNGSFSSTNYVDATQWHSLYSSFYTMRVGTLTPMDAPSTVTNLFNAQKNANPNTILLAALHYNYNQYKTNALTNGDVFLLGERIRDRPGRNPYDTKTAFGVAPLQHHLKGNSFNFKLPSNLVYGNSSQTLTTIQIDFGNGQGYQTITLNSVKNITYTSGGEKELKVKFVYSGGPTLYSHSKLYVDYMDAAAAARFDGAGLLFNREPITGANYLGEAAIGEVTVELASGHTAITKPLIVVEGFDPFDGFDYFNLINTTNPGSINIPITGYPTLNEAIEAKGYDLVFVNFRNSTDFIQRNAFMVEAVIEWVNDNKTGNEQNVVLGMSMGGLVARYALRHMETTGRTHETKLYISHDAPHQGANVPLAYQAFVRHLVGESIDIPLFLNLFGVNDMDITDFAPDLQTGMDLLNSPAAQQMLIYQLQGSGAGISIDNSTLHGSFGTEYSNLGYPSQGGIRNIAIANGSECASPLDFAPYDNLANIDQTVDLPFLATNIAFFILDWLSFKPLSALTSVLSTNTDIKAQFNMKALPNQQAKRIYKGKIFIKKKVLFVINVEEQLIGQKTLYSSSSMLALDNAGGGVYDINQISPLPPEMEQFIIEPRFNFIPTYSSLDIGGGNQTINSTDIARTYSPLVFPASPKNTPFDNFFTNPIISQSHIQFTLNNGNWLLDELQNNQQALYSCASSCTGEILNSVSGPSKVCGNSTFHVTGLSSSASIAWTKSSNLTYVSGQNTNNYRVKKKSSSNSGTGWVRATVQTDCNPIVITESVWVGGPGAFPSLISGRSTLYPGNQEMYFGSIPQGATSWYWSVPSGCSSGYCWDIISTQPTPPGARIQAGKIGDNQIISLTASNSCGSRTSYTYVNVVSSGGGGGGGGDPCGSSLMATPNPTSRKNNVVVLKVILPPPPCDTMMASQTSTNDEVVVTDQMGTEVFRGNPRGDKIHINTRKFKTGTYIATYSYKGTKLQKRFMVN